MAGKADNVSSVSASACHIGGPNSVSPGEILLVYGSFCGSVGMISFLGETKFSLADRGSAIGIKFVTKIYKLTCNVSEFVKAFINCEWHCDHD